MLARQRNIIQERIGNGILFPNIAEAIEKEAHDLVDGIMSELHGEVRKILNLIQSDLNSALGKKGDSTSSGIEACYGNLRQVLEHLKNKHDTVVKVYKSSFHPKTNGKPQPCVPPIVIAKMASSNTIKLLVHKHYHFAPHSCRRGIRK